jgi:K+-transporting ATPase KdpF subunit
VIAGAIDNWVGLGLAVATVVYLVVVLISPERF